MYDWTIQLNTEMGLCMQQVSGQSFYHPSLGQLQKLSLGAVTYMRTTRQMENQESYICWCKKMNKMRSLSELKNVLYLPTKQVWRGGNDASFGGQLQLFFQPYELTLFQMVMSHKMSKIQLKESFLWELCYGLMKYLNLFKQTENEQNTLSFQNVVLDFQSSVKIITQPMIAHNTIQSPQITKQEHQEIELAATASFLPQKLRCSLLQVAGIICLSAAALLDLTNLQQNNHLSWKNMSDKVKKEALKKCRETYSDQLTQVITEMISSTKGNSFIEIINKIEIFMPQVQLGIYEPFKTKQTGKVTLLLPQKLSKLDQLQSVSDCPKNIDLKSTLQTILFEESEIQFPLESHLTIL